MIEFIISLPDTLYSASRKFFSTLLAFFHFFPDLTGVIILLHYAINS